VTLDAVLNAVADVLDLHDPSPADDFLDLGGSSLAAVQIAARLERLLGVRVDPRVVVKSGSLLEVAEALGASAVGEAAVGVAGPQPPSASSPASLAQQWALDAERVDPDAPALQFAVAYTVRGPLEPELLDQALRAVVDHHPVLRTRFERGPDSDTMELVATGPVLLRREQVTESRPRTDRLTAFAQQRFPAFRPPRLRALLLEAGEAEHDLCLSFDHRAADGWSLRVVLEDLSVAYRQLVAGEPVRLPGAGSYLSYAIEERQDAPRRLRRAVAHWSRELPAAYEEFPLTLPGHRAGTPLADPRHVQLAVPPEVADALGVIAAAAGESTFAVATAALARVVAGWTGDTRVRILTSSANRGHADHERTVGWFANGIFPTYNVRPGSPVVELVRHVAETAAAASTVGDVPAAHVRQQLWSDAPTGFRRDSAVYLACNDAWSEPLTLAACAVDSLDLDDRADAPGLQLYLLRGRAGWKLDLYYHDSEYAPAVPDELVRRLLTTIREQASQV